MNVTARKKSAQQDPAAAIRLIDDVELAVRLGYLTPEEKDSPAKVKKARDGVRKLVSRTPELQRARRPLSTDRRGRVTILRYSLSAVEAFIAAPMKPQLEEVTT